MDDVAETSPRDDYVQRGTASQASSKWMRPMWVVSRNSAAADASATATSLSSSRRSKYAAGAPAASGSPWSRTSLRRRWFHLSRRRWHRAEHIAGGWMAGICPTPQDLRLSTHHGG